MARILSVLLFSAFLDALMPEGKAKSGMRTITGLISVLMIAEFLFGVLSNLV